MTQEADELALATKPNPDISPQDPHSGKRKLTPPKSLSHLHMGFMGYVLVCMCEWIDEWN